MKAAPLPVDEQLRLQRLADLVILDTPPERGFDALTRGARLMTGWPISLISLIDAKRQWFKSRDGLRTMQTPREHSFCAHALLQQDLLEIPDALTDERFADNPLVREEPFIRSYVGQSLTVRGVRLGTLCVLHREPKRLSEDQKDHLRCLATAAASLLEERLSRAQKALQQRRLADFSAASGHWLWETNADLLVTWLSDSFESSTGLVSSVLLGRSLFDGVLVDTHGRPVRPQISLHELCDLGRSFSRVVLKVDLGAHQHWLSLSAVPVLEDGDRLKGWRGSARDVTDVVMAEQARDSETQRLRTLVNMVPGSLYQFKVDQQGVASFPFATPGLEALVGVSLTTAARDATEVLGRIHPIDRSRVQESIERSRKMLEPWQESFRISLPDGQERHLSAHSTPVVDDEGAVVWHGLVTDETAQITARIERDQLQSERDHALREGRARSEALSRVSHELRTPLNAILGFTQLMQNGLRENTFSSEIWSPWLQHLHRAASHLLGVTESVLDRTSLQERRFAVDLQPLDSAEVALQALEVVRPKADARDITLEYEFDAAGRLVPGRQEARVFADKRALRQVFLNLLSNACKYSPRGGRVKLWGRDVGAAWRWHVSDDGPGIAPEFQTQLFHPLERGAQRTGNQDGVGLGLAISKKLMESMRGTLTVEPQVGQGSTFSIELPRAESEGVKPSDSQTLPSLFGELDVLHPIGAALMPHAVLLYVEDDPVNGLLMQEFVARTPHLKVHIAPTIAEGLESALELQPDLILLDMHLPDGTGRDFIEQLRGVVQAKVPKVVILSADAMADRLELIRTLCVQGYWTKPLDFDLLRRRLQEVLA